MSKYESYTLFSGGAQGAENQFGKLAEYYGLAEVNYTFEGHRIERTRGVRVLTNEELTRKDVSLTYVAKLLNRKFTNAEKMRKVLQTIMHQVESGHEVFVVGTIQEDGTVKGGTGWGAEFAKICNKDLYVFGQVKNCWFKWEKGAWISVETPVITDRHFTGTGTRFLEENGKIALEELFARSFK
ncbi:hypothetical protein [Pseudodesulfovibrio piezophilus]|uniref:Uncharacterized protein n=1 Tax=Pseudodesulfovibrio piezophilus (strain DSM 21447 / JCM 15486 / C1TLV30) TaxID=1322246 RepID=M1WJN7_PSEP2|nr:hypothetical protein [Pseudodesulfovibrio piezophilus]CCH48216.1 conserved protein of unknown function [Pseudodesulfovibrio piezophilus C1TLV30]